MNRIACQYQLPFLDVVFLQELQNLLLRQFCRQIAAYAFLSQSGPKVVAGIPLVHCF